MESKNTILIVDDEPINIDFIVNNLERYYDIKIAHNGSIALKILKKFPVDLILLDIQMPVMDGYETIKEIKKNPSLQDIPVLFLTAKGDNQSLVYGFELGAKDYITKPFNAKELQVRVHNHIQTYQLIQKLEASQKNLQNFIEKQDNIVILTNSQKIKFANKKFFDFLGYSNLESFLKHHECICEYFIQNDRFFHLDKVPPEKNWVEAMCELPESQRIVSMMGKTFIPHAFSVSINDYDTETMIITFTDISETMLEYMDLEKKTVHDKLTGAFNREFFEQNFQKIITKFTTDNYHLAIALLDIDHFKLVNDTYGHDVGDKILVEFVQVIQKSSRKEDILIRWGGEEFVMLLKVDSKENLEKILEHLRQNIQNYTFSVVGEKTASLGGTLYQAGEAIEKTIKRADESVYIAKAAGRNQVKIL